ncbi:unnamed protein product [Zymoseptoria tritici ST99CH_3D7]|uniref:Uncharacterized protein n=1 Tax=Zymoseptoria tritici (strain ST99CH_3D7) TaxID=1276538 RepID=A0A1X7S9X0_ZYMT9|nr:unnamed protein product [Zymoseptoria tritici ST99CH_3D7]
MCSLVIMDAANTTSVLSLFAAGAGQQAVDLVVRLRALGGDNRRSGGLCFHAGSYGHHAPRYLVLNTASGYQGAPM